MPEDGDIKSTDTTTTSTTTVSVVSGTPTTGTTAADRPKAVIKNYDMNDDMQADVVQLAQEALEQHNIEKDIASFIKKGLDCKFQPTWHVVVGKNFGSYVTHETKHFIYFYISSLAFLIWKS